MTENHYTDVSHALPRLMANVLKGDEVGSRGGRVKELLHQHIVLHEPWRREILTPGRKASLPAQIAETMWLLAGRGDVEWLSCYLPRAVDFSDDGVVWRGAYGPRLRSWRGEFDQLAYVVNLLRQTALTRRAVMMIYDPSIDSSEGKDIPCNDLIQFQSRLGKLHMQVFIRSNDLMWGWSGINTFEWSALQEIVAGLVGIEVGELHFSIGSLHLYDRHWEKARRITEADVLPVTNSSPRFLWPGSLEEFDNLVLQWFDLEEKIRTGTPAVDLGDVRAFPEPMLRSWLQVIAWWWSQDTDYLKPIQGTPLHIAAFASPRQDIVVQAAPSFVADPFIEFVVNLHAQKSAVYGNSWKRRGEQGILSNIARKIDRLGVAGGGDTAADTVIDLLVYCVLYQLWLEDPETNQDEQVADRLRSVTIYDQTDVPSQINALVHSFDLLELKQLEDPTVVLGTMITTAASVARFLWLEEEAAR